MHRGIFLRQCRTLANRTRVALLEFYYVQCSYYTAYNDFSVMYICRVRGEGVRERRDRDRIRRLSTNLPFSFTR